MAVGEPKGLVWGDESARVPASQTPEQDPYERLTPAQVAGRKGGLASAASRRRPVRERALEKLQGWAPELLEELKRAAAGEGEWDKLKAEDRLTALMRLLEWALGRPATKKHPDEPDKPSEQGGLVVN